MKNKIYSIVLIISIVLLAVMAFASCGEDTTQPQKLSAPVVTLNGNTASWEANANADRFEISMDGNLSFVENTTTSKTLLEGQTLKVRAIGDGINYSTSDWSNSVTYRVNSTPVEGEAPTYLGIFASNNEPSQADGLPGNLDTRSTISYKTIRAESYRAFGTALDEYFTNSDNYLEDALPVKSSYDAYARAGEAIYIQIWLNNPSQHTILSLKLNGTKYQVGGGLSSFFIEDNGQKYNCIYVAVTIPNDEYEEKDYTVTDIEYIADTYINADGTDEFMNENDTVAIGLPYNAQSPAISDFNPTSLTMNSCSATLTVEDLDQLVNLSGGWLGIAVYDGYNIVANNSLAIGNNTVSASGLVENTRYLVIAYLYADLHDGKGVTTHILFEQSIRTPEAITVNEINGALLYNSEKDGYYGAIMVNTALNSNTAQYMKLEILNYNDEVVYSDTSFNGSATISSGILCGESYRVRVYYKDTEYPEGKYIEQDAWVNSLGTPWYQEYGTYTFVNDAVYYFQLSNGDNNYPAINSFVLKLYKQESARWVATDVLYILENPTAIDDLEGQIDALHAKMNELPRGEEMDAVYNQIQELQAILEPLDYAKWYLESRADNNTDKSYWQQEAAKGKYFYEFEYNGTNTEKLFKQGKTFYVVLDDVLTYEIGGLDIALTYNYDKLNGKGPFDEEVNYQSINLDRELTSHWVEMENVSYSDGNLTLTLFNEADRWTGYRPPFAIGYVYKVEIDGKILYIDESKHTIDVDEQAWFNEYIALVKAEQSVDGLMEKYVPDYESSYTVPIDKSKLEAGSRNFGVYIRLVNTSYKDDEYHACRWSDSVAVYTQIQKPIIECKELWGETYGVVTPESIDNWYNDHYKYEAIDKDGNPVEIEIASEAGYARFYLPAAGTKVRVKIPASGYWLESEWSEWYTFE